jgi:YD repeat-containing protein
MRTATAALLAALATEASAQSTTVEPQQRLYDSRGNSVGVIAPSSEGTLKFYDPRGNLTGSSTTSPSGTTTFYDSRGNVTGRATMPSATPAGKGR